MYSLSLEEMHYIFCESNLEKSERYIWHNDREIRSGHNFILYSQEKIVI